MANRKTFNELEELAAIVTKGNGCEHSTMHQRSHCPTLFFDTTAQAPQKLTTILGLKSHVLTLNETVLLNVLPFSTTVTVSRYEPVTNWIGFETVPHSRWNMNGEQAAMAGVTDCNGAFCTKSTVLPVVSRTR